MSDLLTFTDAQIQKAMDLYATGATSVVINGRSVAIAGDLLRRIQQMQAMQGAAASSNKTNSIRMVYRRSSR